MFYHICYTSKESQKLLHHNLCLGNMTQMSLRWKMVDNRVASNKGRNNYSSPKLAATLRLCPLEHGRGHRMIRAIQPTQFFSPNVITSNAKTLRLSDRIIAMLSMKHSSVIFFVFFIGFSPFLNISLGNLLNRTVCICRPIQINSL